MATRSSSSPSPSSAPSSPRPAPRSTGSKSLTGSPRFTEAGRTLCEVPMSDEPTPQTDAPVPEPAPPAEVPAGPAVRCINLMCKAMLVYGEAFEMDPDYQAGTTDWWCQCTQKPQGPDGDEAAMHACFNP